jgi:predicted DNA-binding transcriptional regulator YafY
MITAKRPALRRLWVIDRALRKGTYPTAKQLAEMAEVDEKTILRDLKMMQIDFKAPAAFNWARRGWEYTERTYQLPAVLITEGELVAMFLAGQALQIARGTPYADDLQRAIKKLSEFLPDEVSVHWQALDQTQSFHQTVTTLHDVDVFRELAEAVLHRRQVRIRYWTASRDAETERIINPWHLTMIDGGDFYLIAYCHERKTTRMFAPGRIREIVPTGESFDIPSDFRIGDFFDGAFKVVSDSNLPTQTVRLKFAPSAAKYIREKVWHGTQKQQREADGGVVLELSLRSFVEVRRWILSWGGECEVLAPEELKADIRREAAAILKQSAGAAPQSAVAALDQIRKQKKRRQANGKTKRTG